MAPKNLQLVAIIAAVIIAGVLVLSTINANHYAMNQPTTTPIHNGSVNQTTVPTTSTQSAPASTIAQTALTTIVTNTVTYATEASDSPYFDTMYVSDHFKVYFRLADQGMANVLIQTLEHAYPIDSRIYGGDLPSKTDLYMFHTFYDAKGLMPMSSTASPNSSGGGWSVDPPLGDGIKIYNTLPHGDPNNLSNVENIDWYRGGMAHELGHRFFYYLYPNIRAPVRPNWLDEGIAMYDWAEAGGDIEYGFGVARENISINGPVLLNSLDKLQESSNTIELFYGEASTVIDYMVSRAGERGLREFLDTYNQTKNL
ncbi:MAG: hypothetical protein KGQ83_10885, partial [Planctomycetes bacterium]|nr:hypothetical protein [Planctomycetota bacterium]